MPVWYQIFSPLSWYKAHTFFDQNNRECFNVAFRRQDINKVFSEQVAMEMASNFIEESIKLLSLRYKDCVQVLSAGSHRMAVRLIQGESNTFCLKQYSSYRSVSD
jgi:hypothetical protein